MRERLIADYAAYVGSFISLRDQRIRERVDKELKKAHASTKQLGPRLCGVLTSVPANSKRARCSAELRFSTAADGRANLE